MLGCGAHVRIIALSHVRCACGSACGKGLELCVRKCVRMGIFQSVICDSTFLPVCCLCKHTFNPNFGTNEPIHCRRRCTHYVAAYLSTYSAIYYVVYIVYYLGSSSALFSIQYYVTPLLLKILWTMAS